MQSITFDERLPKAQASRSDSHTRGRQETLLEWSWLTKPPQRSLLFCMCEELSWVTHIMFFKPRQPHKSTIPQHSVCERMLQVESNIFEISATVRDVLTLRSQQWHFLFTLILAYKIMYSSYCIYCTLPTKNKT